MKTHRGLLHHLILVVSDMKRSSLFYGPVFRYLGYELAGSSERYEDWKRWELDTPHEISIVAGDPELKGVPHARGAVGHHHHLAFCALDRADVDRFHAEVLVPLQNEGLCTIEDPPVTARNTERVTMPLSFTTPTALSLSLSLIQIMASKKPGGKPGKPGRWAKNK